MLCAVLMAVGAGSSLLRPPAPPLPGRAISESPVPVSMRSCRDCHPEQVDAFEDAPHLRTLTPASDPEMQARFKGTVRLREERADYRYFLQDGGLWVESDAYPDPVKVDWIFGSGQHAQTPVSVWEDPEGRSVLLEHAVSWYPDAGLGATLGIDPELHLHAGPAALGKILDHGSALDCFGCHVTYLPVDGRRIAQADLVTGVRCERCHTGTARHVEAMERGDDHTLLERWADLDALESVNRCGECHRRADQLTASEITPDNEMLIRFAPVGLVQSGCFKKQLSGAPGAGRFDCLTCHDPHRPAESDPAYYVAKCVACHAPEPHGGRTCSVSATQGCLDCHMPKVEVHPNLWFTDHWIRVRQDLE